MAEVLVNRLGGLSLPRKSVVRLTDRPDMTLDVYRGRKTTMQQQQISNISDLNQTVRLTIKLLTGLSLTLAVLKHTEAYFMVSFHAAAQAVF